MADDSANWAGLLQLVLSNPEKGALFLVIVAGAWRWIKELMSESKTEGSKESFMDTLIRENKELRSELRSERRKVRRRYTERDDDGDDD